MKLPQKSLPAKVEKPVKEEEIKPIACHPQRLENIAVFVHCWII